MNDRAKLEDLINRADKLISGKVTASAPEFKAWRSSCKMFLAKRYGKDSCELKEFKKINYNPLVLSSLTTDQEFIDVCKRGLLSAQLVLKELLSDFEEKTMNSDYNDKVFIVHGHDDGLKYKIKSLLMQLGLKPIILHEQISSNDTIIEKLERYGQQAKAAIVLFTPDDFGQAKTEEEKQSRARQNVVFEAGFFIGLLGRSNVIIVRSDDSVILPGDLDGVVYSGGNNDMQLAIELKAKGFEIDLNRLAL